jgi:hypothetical protein
MTQGGENNAEGETPNESGGGELNRLVSEEEYSNDRAEQVLLVMNHTPKTSSPSSSNSRHNSQTTPNEVTNLF